MGPKDKFLGEPLQFQPVPLLMPQQQQQQPQQQQKIHQQQLLLQLPEDSILDEPLHFQPMPLLMTQMQQQKIIEQQQQHKSNQTTRLVDLLSQKDMETLKRNLYSLKQDHKDLLHTAESACLSELKQLGQMVMTFKGHIEKSLEKYNKFQTDILKQFAKLENIY